LPHLSEGKLNLSSFGYFNKGKGKVQRGLPKEGKGSFLGGCAALRKKRRAPRAEQRRGKGKTRCLRALGEEPEYELCSWDTAA